MTALDDSLFASIFIMIFVTSHYLVRVLPAVVSALTGDWTLLYDFWAAGWFYIICGTLLLCSIILIAGAVCE